MSDENDLEIDYLNEPKDYTIINEASKYKELKSIKGEDLENISKKIFDIKIGNSNGIGFFCKIPDPDIINNPNNIKVLLTCYHVIKIKEIDTIKYQFLNIEKEINLKEKERRIWYNEKEDYDYTCIEILEKDKIDENDCLNIDKNISLNNYTKDNLLNKVVYIFKAKEVSIGNIKTIKEMNLIYNNDTKSGWSGSPVIRKDNNQVIAIHKNGIIKQNNTNFLANRGILIKYMLMDMDKEKKEIQFNEKWKNEKK